MEDKTRLINIYLKIHQKRDLTWDDLEYLACFDPECFEKTCKNVVYNIPQTKPVILQDEKEEKKLLPSAINNKIRENKFSIERVLKNLRLVEVKQIPIAEFDIERVKNLLGNLYMELLFPHNDQDSFWSAVEDERGTRFDKKA